MRRVVEITGDGRIEGWDVVAATFPDVIVTQGSGIVDGFYVNTYDDQIFELSANGVFYLFAQRRVDTVGTIGPKSDIASISYSDSTPPAMPVGLAAIDVDPFSVHLSWTSNTEVDFDHYDIERDGGAGFVIRDSVDENEFIDETDEDSSYVYRVYAVDQSGNRSTYSQIAVVTPLDATPPPNPFNVVMPPSEAGVNILWSRPPSLVFSKISAWKLTYVRLNSDNSINADTLQEIEIDRLLYHYRVDGLIDGERYRFTLQTVDSKNRESTGVSYNVGSLPNTAPRDPINITYTMQESPSGVQVNLAWESGDTPYDPATSYRYKIYVTIYGQQESVGIDVPIGASHDEISLYSFNLLEYFSIPENTLVTFRVTSLDQFGYESFGSYVRFVTDTFSAPERVANLTGNFDENTGSITVTWENKPDTDNINMHILNASLNPVGSNIEVINSDLGIQSVYVLPDVLLDYKYSIYVTPSNSRGESGEPSLVIVITTSSDDINLPDAPTSLSVKPGDREVLLTWDVSTSNYAASYRVYRKTGEIDFTLTNWSLIDILPKDYTRYTDYGLENDQIYSYYVTTVDIYGRESINLSTGGINLNFVEATPRKQGILTHPINVQTSISSGTGKVVVTWDALTEEENSFTVYRSVNNLHQWNAIGNTNKDVHVFVDEELPLINGTTFYYLVGKTINDADLIMQSSSLVPENAINLATITTSASDFTVDYASRRDILNMADPITEYTTQYLLPHKHREIEDFDPTRIDLSSSITVTSWSSTDGKIFVTTEDITGDSYFVTVDGRFPASLYSVDSINKRITFSEPITEVDPDTGDVLGDMPSVSLKIFGTEEVQNELETFRFDHLHAKQVQFGRLNFEQIPPISHIGRVKETLLPKSFLLERFNDHTFIVGENNQDESKNFGDGTTFFALTESDGNIDDIVKFSSASPGATVAFQRPSYSSITTANIKTNDLSEVVASPAFQSSRSYHFRFEFIDSSATRWVRISTTNTAISPNPVISMGKRLRFKMLLQRGSIYMSLGVREITRTSPAPGSNGGISGPIEWVNIDSVITASDGSEAPKGQLIEPNDEWQQIDINLRNDGIINFQDGNSTLDGDFGTLEHIAFTIKPDALPGGAYDIYITDIQQVDDVLVAGTSQGILLSQDFGVSWELSRLTPTPVHKFFKSSQNPFLWAITATDVLLSVDPAFWFVTSGLTGVQYIKDIAEDLSGNIYVSTDKGVYWLDISLIDRFSTFRQTQPVNAFTTDCYGMYSIGDEIYVSTEIGIYKTNNRGQSWSDTGMSTEGLVAYQFIDAFGRIFAITRKHLMRKLSSSGGFYVIANLEDQFNVDDIWKFAFFDGRIYISTGSGVYMNAVDDVLTTGLSNIEFERIFPSLDSRNSVRVAFGLDVVDMGDYGEKLFLGQENRLVASDELNTVSVKTIYNKESPSFYADKKEQVIGYIYGTFNKVVAFREPRGVTETISAAYLPRKTFVAINGGWSHNNIDADVFIYKNGVPTWLDFEVDQPTIVNQMATETSRLSAITTLTDFNSQYPLSQAMLDKTLQDAAVIQSGGDNGGPNISSTTISQFIDDYSRFISLVSSDVVETNALALPDLPLNGITRESRETNSRSQLLEEKESFTAEDSTGIVIGTTTGTVDFTTALANATEIEDKAKYVFDKYDRLTVTVFGSNLSNTGELSHRDIEDAMEYVNTGLTSDLARSHYTNLIQSGIYIEGRHPGYLNSYPTRTIQAKFNSASTNDWYDILNSTIDYKTIIKTSGDSTPSIANCCLITTDGLWVGTNDDIVVYAVDALGNISITKTLHPSADESLSIRDIIEHDSAIFVVGRGSRETSIFSTSNHGDTWSQIDTNNLPTEVYNFAVLNGIKIATTENGVWYSDNDLGEWFTSSVSTSTNLSTGSKSPTQFTKNILNSEFTTFVIAESDRYFYTSGNGVEFLAVGRLENNSAKAINKIKRFKNLTWVATDRGLYSDANSIISDSVQFGLQDILNELSESVSVKVLDISVGTDAIYCCSDDGKLYRYLDVDPDDDTDNEWKSYAVPNTGAIHKIIIYEVGDVRRCIAFTHDKVLSIDITPSTGVFDT